MKKVCICLLVFTMALCVGFQSSAQNRGVDVLYLKNGSIIKGSITELIPGSSVKIQTRDGSLFVYKLGEVDRVSKDESVVDVQVQKAAQQSDGKAPFRKKNFVFVKGGLSAAGVIKTKQSSERENLRPLLGFNLNFGEQFVLNDEGADVFISNETGVASRGYRLLYNGTDEDGELFKNEYKPATLCLYDAVNVGVQFRSISNPNAKMAFDVYAGVSFSVDVYGHIWGYPPGILGHSVDYDIEYRKFGERVDLAPRLGVCLWINRFAIDAFCQFGLTKFMENESLRSSNLCIRVGYRF